MLIPVVLAGGAGTRLWPLSRAALPKQFVAFPGREHTLFQETLLRLGDRAGAPVVVCNEQHRFLAAEQLRQADIAGARMLLEPAPRNTAPAAALAALEATETDAEALLLVLPSDHAIGRPERLLAAIAEAEGFAREGYLMTFGIVPDAPATGYGYMAAGEALGQSSARKLDRFVEKPDPATAEAYLASGDYLWNSGMFLFGAATYLAELERYAPGIYEVCRLAHEKIDRGSDFSRYPDDAFANCRKLSIDYAVMEHTGRGAMIPLDAGWSDLGAWDAVWNNAERDEQGNSVSGDVIGRDLRGSHIQAGSRLIAALGLRDLLVVDTADALLVADRARAQEVGEIVRDLQRQARAEAEHHRLVDRPWGSFETLAAGPGFQVKHLIVNPGAALSLQSHARRTEHWTVVRGRGVVICGDREFELGVNESTEIPLGSKHRIRNDGIEPVEIIEVQLGDYLGEDDIVRYEDRYDRV
ncbi:MAG: mannose-1-phosphate guanylyltransferase/mannose-6-phosphate isomerase [Gammaproteobacteria bacterium]|nr:mannose-1-phosphate guanylyltransferase/mannose-6-phosphate isomerase [Gammaproteobacteria bacterium]MYH84652.1 mannose-1-phosphate guanylyltransferase/mannose-6-phosphate isomerase [Gammaproteobacteria bacterium]MYK03979.1 mannose-1-phosphate guanylyltransferase/mannose-6-phosphate isomerase [Gammaproteobacteria bacterium]